MLTENVQDVKGANLFLILSVFFLIYFYFTTIKTILFATK